MLCLLNRRRIIIACLLSITALSASSQSREKTLHELNSLLINTVMDDLFTPPVACRIYTYPNIAFYECIRREEPSFPSLAGKLNGLKPLPAPNQKTDYYIAASISFSYVAQSLVGSEYKLEDWRNTFSDSMKAIMDTSLFASSAQYGKQVADTIIKWIRNDHYLESRGLMRYVASSKHGTWQPTPVDFAQALEPHWGTIRPMTMKTAAQFAPSKKLVFSLSKQSVFYKNVLEVYTIVNTLDSVKKAIAWYWDDNPNVSVEEGHLTYYIHKVSPGGHWIMITRQACMEKNIPLVKAAQAYALTSIALFDAFISCWHEKFKTNLIRPVTIINNHIDEKWVPLIQTPPFPEFTSGHAMVSNAAAAVLTKLLGANYAFTDNTEIPFNIKPRTFKSFYAAAEESAWSRVYGGIHYPETARISITQGRLIGNHVVKTCGQTMPPAK